MFWLLQTIHLVRSKAICKRFRARVKFCVIHLALPVISVGGPAPRWIDPELRLLSVQSFTCSPYVRFVLSSPVSSHFPKHILVGGSTVLSVSERRNVCAWSDLYSHLTPRTPRIVSTSTSTLTRIKCLLYTVWTNAMHATVRCIHAPRTPLVVAALTFTINHQLQTSV